MAHTLAQKLRAPFALAALLTAFGMAWNPWGYQGPPPGAPSPVAPAANAGPMANPPGPATPAQGQPGIVPSGGSGNFGAPNTRVGPIHPSMALVVTFGSTYAGVTTVQAINRNGTTGIARTGIAGGRPFIYRGPTVEAVQASQADSTISWELLPDGAYNPFDSGSTNIGSITSKPFSTVSSLAGGGADFNGNDAIDAALDALPVGGAITTPAKGGTVFTINDGIHGVTAASGIEMPNTNNVTLIGEQGTYVQAQAAMTNGIFINSFRTRGHIIESILFDENNFATQGVYWVLTGTNETGTPSYWLDVEVLAGSGVGGGAVANTACFQIGTYDAGGTGKGYEDMVWVDCVASGDVNTGLSWNYQIPSGEGTLINPKSFGKPFFTNCVGLYIEGGAITCLAGGLGTSVSTAANAATGNLSPCLLEVHNVQLSDNGSAAVGTYPPPRQGDAAIALTNLPPVTLGVFDSVNTRLGACEGGLFENNYYVINAQTGATVILFQIGLFSTTTDRIGFGPTLKVVGGHVKLTAAIAGGAANPAISLFSTYGSSAGTVVNDGLFIMYQTAFGTGNISDLVLGAASTTQMIHEHLILTGSSAVTKWTPTGQNLQIAAISAGTGFQNTTGRPILVTYKCFNPSAGTGTVVLIRGKAVNGTDFQNESYTTAVQTTETHQQYSQLIPPGEWAKITITGTGASLVSTQVVAV